MLLEYSIVRESNADIGVIFLIVPNKGPFNNYVDKMRGEGVKKYLFLSRFRV